MTEQLHTHAHMRTRCCSISLRKGTWGGNSRGTWMSNDGFQLDALPNYQICNHFTSILKVPPHCLLASAVLKSKTILSHDSSFFLTKFCSPFHWKDWCRSWNSQYFGHLMRRTDSLGKTLMLGKTEGRRRRGQQRVRQLDSITDSVDMNLRDDEGQGSLACCGAYSHKELNIT